MKPISHGARQRSQLSRRKQQIATADRKMTVRWLTSGEHLSGLTLSLKACCYCLHCWCCCW